MFLIYGLVSSKCPAKRLNPTSRMQPTCAGVHCGRGPLRMRGSIIRGYDHTPRSCNLSLSPRMTAYVICIRLIGR